MCITWLLFWYFDIGSYIRSKYFSADFCLLIFIGFALRFIGELVLFDLIGWVGGFIVFYALYKAIKPTKSNTGHSTT